MNNIHYSISCSGTIGQFSVLHTHLIYPSSVTHTPINKSFTGPFLIQSKTVCPLQPAHPLPITPVGLNYFKIFVIMPAFGYHLL